MLYFLLILLPHISFTRVTLSNHSICNVYISTIYHYNLNPSFIFTVLVRYSFCRKRCWQSCSQLFSRWNCESTRFIEVNIYFVFYIIFIIIIPLFLLLLLLILSVHNLLDLIISSTHFSLLLPVIIATIMSTFPSFNE